MCGVEQASVLCCADEAALCSGCNDCIHSANKLAGKHRRFSLILPSHRPLPLCDICKKRTGLFSARRTWQSYAETVTCPSIRQTSPPAAIAAFYSAESGSLPLQSLLLKAGLGCFTNDEEMESKRDFLPSPIHFLPSQIERVSKSHVQALRMTVASAEYF